MSSAQIGVAKYVQLRNTLADAIAAGSWKVGERLPAEDEIARTSGVSLGTVQRALRMLVDAQTRCRHVRRIGRDADESAAPPLPLPR
jgi:DNA-binding GntR family transcriptional regulator